MPSANKRAAFERLIERLPLLKQRHKVRLVTRQILKGDTNEMKKSLFADINELKWLLVDVESNSYTALVLFIEYLDYARCKADAWKLRMLVSVKFPDGNINFDDQDMVTTATTATLMLLDVFLICCLSLVTGWRFFFIDYAHSNLECTSSREVDHHMFTDNSV